LAGGLYRYIKKTKETAEPERAKRSVTKKTIFLLVGSFGVLLVLSGLFCVKFIFREEPVTPPEKAIVQAGKESRRSTTMGQRAGSVSNKRGEKRPEKSDEAAERAGHSTLSWRDRAQEALSLGNFMAVKEILQSLSPKEKSVGVLNDLGATLILLGECRRAQQILEQALRKAEDPVTKLNLVLALYCDGRVEKAKRLLGEIKANTLSPEARELFKALKRRLGGPGAFPGKRGPQAEIFFPGLSPYRQSFV
jgi:tetratricopeptide (TPR) repeat protein